jgi:hypothetical protein
MLIIETLQLMELTPKKNDNPNYYVCVMIFQRYKGAILNTIYTFCDIYIIMIASINNSKFKHIGIHGNR